MSRESDSRVFLALLETGIPGTRIAWPIDQRPPIPCFSYRVVDGEIHADGSNYAEVPSYEVELLTADDDADLVEAFALAVADFGPYRHREGWSNEHNCYSHLFTFTYTWGRQ